MLLEEGHTACGMNRAAVEELVAGLEEKVQQLADTLSVDVAGGTDYSELLAQAHARLANVAEEVAGDLAAASANTGAQNTPMADILASLAQAAASVSDVASPAASAPETVYPLGPCRHGGHGCPKAIHRNDDRPRTPRRLCGQRRRLHAGRRGVL